jgi:hypothetical protein
MELVTKKRLHLLAGRSNLPLAEEIADHLGVELGHANLVEFANGEIHSRLGENAGYDVIPDDFFQAAIPLKGDFFVFHGAILHDF